MRRIFRFGRKLRGEDLPNVPERFRGVHGPSGRLVSVRLRPSTGEAWFQLEESALPLRWRAVTKTIPLHDRQPLSPVPAPDIVEMRGGMRVLCDEGFVGKLEGVVVVGAGVVEALLVRVRGDVEAVAEEASSRLAALLPVSGREVLVPASWILSAKEDERGRSPFGGEGTVRLAATAEQIASAEVPRADADIAGDVWRLLNENPALAPYVSRIHVEVAAGEVTLRGTVPSQRHRATAEQDTWHVSGVASVHNELDVTG